MAEGERESLESLRKQIQSIDEGLVKLLNQRFEVSEKVGLIKAGSGSPIFQPSREAELLSSLQSLRAGPMKENHLRNIYREIFSVSKDLQNMKQISYLGPAGSYTHQAAICLFGASCPLTSAQGIDAVFRDVESGRADMGVVPVENSIEGVVAQTLDRLRSSDVLICSEVNQPISHHLLSHHQPKDVTKVFSHPQAFGQCREWLSHNLPWAEMVESASTAAAVESATQLQGAGAIGSEAASAIYGLPILKKGIEDRPGNQTRFLVIGSQRPTCTGDDKTSICFSLVDRAGVLHDALLPLKEAGLNMSMIQSRPVRDRNWEYVFFVDMLGHRDEEKMSRALKGLAGHCSHFKILGSYPRARPA